MKTDSRDKNHPVNTVPIAIIGLGSIYPQADNTGRFWTNIKNRVDAITEVPESHWRSDDYYDQDPKVADKVYAKLGGFLSPVEFSPMDYGILPNAIEAIDTSQLLGLLAVEQALKDAGYTPEKEFDHERVSVILGITGTLELVVPLGARLGYPRWKEALADAGVEKELAEDVIKRISDSYVPWQENSFPGLLGNVVAGRISKHFNFGGTNCTVDAACGSSLSALNLAILELSSGRSDMAVTGGIDTFNDIFMYTCFSKTPALSPSGHARPYDANTDGTTLGEGLGIVVLKRLDDAERDGDNIYAVVKGLGASSDGSGSAIYEPSAKGQAKAFRRAYEQGNVTPDTIELIEGHGTGTRVGDAVEVAALHDVFGKAEKPWCALGSIKSQIGHAKAAAGVAGLIKASLALYHKVLPPTIKVDQPAESLTAADTPFYVNTEARPWVTRGDHPRRAGISALGFGGSNFHCLLEEYHSAKQVVDWDGNVQIIPFSAADDTELKSQLSDFNADMEWSQLRLEADRLRRQYQTTDSSRLILVVEKDQTKRTSQLQNALALLEKN
ncbi:MAG: beta-ketoacyl synthase N-terminal-like domain-containing protein, partial [Desulfuromusa sp.]|nr:beta-ketoacyl synthase N-terminal-like domain-containing protein [Desulfuromusa sp.]